MALGAGGVACSHGQSFLVDEVAVPKLQSLWSLMVGRLSESVPKWGILQSS